MEKKREEDDMALVTASEVFNCLDNTCQELANLEAVAASAHLILDALPYRQADQEARRLVCLVSLLSRMVTEVHARVATDLEQMEARGARRLLETSTSPPLVMGKDFPR